jgi:hypothetical protein
VDGRAPPVAVTRARSGHPAGSPVARMSGRRPGRSLPCPPRPVGRGNVRPTGRVDIQHPGVWCPGVRCPAPGASRCPDGQALVSAALPPRCPRRAGPRVARWRATPAAVGRRAAAACGRRGCLPASGRTGRDGAALAVAGWHEVDRSPRPPLGRRPGCGAAWPAGRHGAGPGQGAGRVAGSPGTKQVFTGPAGRPGQVAGVVLTNGPGPGGVTTLRGRWARVVRWRPASEGPLGSVGEQPAAAARPQRVRSAVR